MPILRKSDREGEGMLDVEMIVLVLAVMGIMLALLYYLERL